jgi:hypothetical protein
MVQQEFVMSNLLSSLVLLVVALVTVIFCGIGIARTNAYQKEYEGYDLVSLAAWNNADDESSGVSRAKTIQFYILMATISTMILSAFSAYVLKKLWGNGAAAVYAVMVILGLMQAFIRLYYTTTVGKNRVEGGAAGSVENDDVVDVNHAVFSMVNTGFAFMLVHAVLAGAVTAYFAYTHWTVKKEDSEPVARLAGAGRSESGANLSAGARFWAERLGHVAADGGVSASTARGASAARYRQ